MKARYFKITALFLLALTLSSCVKFKHDPIDDNSELYPELENAKVVSLEQLMGTFPGSYDSMTQEAGSNLDYYLLVQVLGNDITGNIYKSMYVRDVLVENGRAINLAIDKTGLYNFFPIGQKFYLKCSGLYIGEYSGLPQIGFRYQDDNGKWSLGRIPDQIFMDHTFKYGPAPVDSADKPQPIEITSLSQLDNKAMYNQLILLHKVHFLPDDIGQEFAPAPPSGSNPTSTDHYFTVDGEGSELTLRTSSACRFFRSLVPEGEGDMVCIYTIYGSTKQFYLRALSDLNLEQFAANANVNKPIFSESFAAGIGDFKAVNIKGSAVWEYSSNYDCMLIKAYQTGENEDWLYSPEIDLSDATDFGHIDLSFDQAINYASNGTADMYTIRVSETFNGEGNPSLAEWKTLKIPNPHPGNSFTFTPTGAINLNDYAGKKVRVAFVLKNSSSVEPTWEVKNLKIVGNE